GGGGDGADQQSVGAAHGGGLAVDEGAQAADVALLEGLDVGEQNDAEAEEDGQDDADGGVFHQARVANNGVDREDAQDAGDRRADEEHGERTTLAAEGR